ncbi:MAG: DUF4252 domain-containing protein [Bacteroidota bacterium]
MKKLLFILVMTVIPMLAFAQKSSISQFMKKYDNDENAEKLRLGGLVLDLAVSFSDDKDSKKWLKKLKRIRLLVLEEKSAVSDGDYRQLIKGIQNDKYSPLIKLRDAGNSVDIFAQEDGEHIRKVCVIVRSDDEFILLDLHGLLKFEDLNDLELEMEGSDYLKKLPDDRSKLPKA